MDSDRNLSLNERPLAPTRRGRWQKTFSAADEWTSLRKSSGLPTRSGCRPDPDGPSRAPEWSRSAGSRHGRVRSARHGQNLKRTCGRTTQFWQAAYGSSWLEATLPRVDVLLIRYCEAARGLAQTGIDQSEHLTMVHQDHPAVCFRTNSPLNWRPLAHIGLCEAIYSDCV